MPYADDAYARAKMAQYQYMVNVLRQQELERKTIYVDMGKTMGQAVDETAELLTKQDGKERVHAESTAAS